METRGAIYLHKEFKFSDGEKADKFFILLNSPSKGEPFLFVKTTSQQKHRPVVPGCIETISTFFIPANKVFFDKNTWVLLHDIYPIEHKTIKGSPKVSLVGDLDASMIDAVLECLSKTQKNDIAPSHERLIWPNKLKSLDKLLEKYGRKY